MLGSSSFDIYYIYYIYCKTTWILCKLIKAWFSYAADLPAISSPLATVRRPVLRWIAGVLKLARNANRIGPIFNSFISNMDRIVLLERQYSLALLVMRYTRRKKKLEKMRTRRNYWVRPRVKNYGQYHTLFPELRHPRGRHFPPPFRKSGIVLLRHT